LQQKIEKWQIYQVNETHGWIAFPQDTSNVFLHHLFCASSFMIHGIIIKMAVLLDVK
jgi:hypothetical protein